MWSTIAYAIGVAQPVSIAVDTFGTGNVEEAELVSHIRELFYLRQARIIKILDILFLAAQDCLTLIWAISNNINSLHREVVAFVKEFVAFSV